MKIICIGRNYADHAKELNNPIPDRPVVFQKPPTALLKGGRDFYLPDFSQDIHHEIELVLKICKNGKYIQEKFAHKYYEQIGLGIDFTARDLQSELKSKGQPWELAKAFDSSAVIGDFLPKATIASEQGIDFSLQLNEQVVQQGNTLDLMFGFDYIIHFVSQYFTLQQGDLIYTGTPAGVGRVQSGDVLKGFIGDEQLLQCKVK